MRVRALKSFGGLGPQGRVRVRVGEVFEMPDGADWLQAGLVEALPLERETAALEAPERAEMPRPKRKRAGSES